MGLDLKEKILCVTVPLRNILGQASHPCYHYKGVASPSMITPGIEKFTAVGEVEYISTALNVQEISAVM